MQSRTVRLFLGALLMGVLPLSANAGTTSFGPTEYLETGDTPAAFYTTDCDLHIEDFEDALVDEFLTIDNGEIFPPNGVSGSNTPLTDSVDGDDGSVDGFGLEGYSWFTGSVNNVTITFASSVTSAGLVFTDGDSASTDVMLEAFDSDGNSLGVINAGDLADGSFAGETAEDRFLGFHDMDGAIASITLSINAGSGIEIDHIHWQHCVPEPSTAGMALMAVLGMCGLRRRRR